MKTYLLALSIFTAILTPTTSFASPVISSVNNFSTWQDMDLSKKFASINIKLKLPRNVNITKNGNGNAEIDLGNHSVLTVSQIAVIDLNEAMKTANDYYLNDASYINVKKIVVDANGFVYTRQLKTEETGYSYSPESHFVYYLVGKDGAVYEIQEDVEIDYIGKAKPNEFSAQRASDLYQFIKNNAKVIE